MNFITSGRDGRNEDLDGGAKIKIWAALFWIAVWEIVALFIGQEILLVSPVAVFLRFL